jgi:hypothetical protein
MRDGSSPCSPTLLLRPIRPPLFGFRTLRVVGGEVVAHVPRSRFVDFRGRSGSMRCGRRPGRCERSGRSGLPSGGSCQTGIRSFDLPAFAITPGRPSILGWRADSADLVGSDQLEPRFFTRWRSGSPSTHHPSRAGCHALNLDQRLPQACCGRESQLHRHAATTS